MSSEPLRIGFCDSGIGGMIMAIDWLARAKKTIVSISREYNVPIEIYHMSDYKTFPYGNKDDETILKSGSQMISKMFNVLKCDLVVIACNTLSSKIKLYKLENSWHGIIDIIEPSACGIFNKALENSKQKNKSSVDIMLLGTQSLFRSNIFEQYVRNHAKSIGYSGELRVETYSPNIKWQENVEHGIWDTEGALDLVQQDVVSLVNSSGLTNIDCIGMFCTHYPMYARFLEKIISRFEKAKHASIVTQGSLVHERIMTHVRTLLYSKSKGAVKKSQISVRSIYVSDETSSSIIKGLRESGKAISSKKISFINI